MLEPILVFWSASNANETAPAATKAINRAASGRSGLNQPRDSAMPEISFTSPIPSPAKRLSSRQTANAALAVTNALSNRHGSAPRIIAKP